MVAKPASTAALALPKCPQVMRPRCVRRANSSLRLGTLKGRLARCEASKGRDAPQSLTRDAQGAILASYGAIPTPDPSCPSAGLKTACLTCEAPAASYRGLFVSVPGFRRDSLRRAPRMTRGRAVTELLA
jgi:hypothetical protein